MKYIINGRGTNVTDGLRNAIEEKLGKLEHYFTPDTEVHVTLKVEKDRQKVEVTVPVKGHIIRAEQVSDDMYVSIDLIEDIIKRQLRRYKRENRFLTLYSGRRGFPDVLRPHRLWFFPGRFLPLLGHQGDRMVPDLGNSARRPDSPCDYGIRHLPYRSDPVPGRPLDDTGHTGPCGGRTSDAFRRPRRGRA